MGLTRRRWVESVLLAGTVQPLRTLAGEGDIVVGQV